MNKRQNLRISLALGGELTINSDSHFIETSDVSLSGAWLDYVPRAVEIGRDCFLTLFIGEEDDAVAVTFRGRIAFSNGEGCGVQFVSVDDQDFAIFAQHMLKHSQDEAALKAEIERGFVPFVEEWETI